jgi:hypothetical protein
MRESYNDAAPHVETNDMVIARTTPGEAETAEYLMADG